MCKTTTSPSDTAAPLAGDLVPSAQPSVRSPNDLCFVKKRVQAFLLLLPVLQHWCWLLKGSTHLFPPTGTGEGRQEEEPEREQLAHA